MHRVLLPFEFSEPASVAEAADMVDGDRVRALAGGVDLVLKMRLRQIVPERVVSLQKIPGLAYVRPDTQLGSGALRIGALATVRDVELSQGVLQGWPLLAEAIGSIVSIQTTTSPLPSGSATLPASRFARTNSASAGNPSWRIASAPT